MVGFHVGNAHDWIYENHANTLHQINHIHFDFTTPKGLKITLSDEKKTGEQGNKDKRVEEKRLTFFIIF